MPTCAPVILRQGEHAPTRGRARGCRPAAVGRGFTLVEIMMVILIISVLAMLAVPAVQRIQRRSRTATICNDFRVFGAAFDTYAQEFGKWPADSAAGVFPTGMDQRISRTAWLRTTPMGGQYNWEYHQLAFGASAPLQAAIAISATARAPLTFDINQLTDLERAIDSNGVLTMTTITTGSFRLGLSLNPFFVIAP